jgi:acetylglutamate kinase
MKLFVDLGNCRLDEDQLFCRFANTAAELLADGHRLVVLHGGTNLSTERTMDLCADSGNSRHKATVDSRNLASLILSGKINRQLVVSLARVRIASFGLCAADGNIIRARVTTDRARYNTLDVAEVNPFWLEMLSSNGGVPVMTNIALGPDGRYAFIKRERMASACAIAWNADALVFLTRALGVRTLDGSVLRWLKSSEINTATEDEGLDGMRSKLDSCLEALKCGVRRARVFPISEIEKLPLFYVSRIDAGTEVLLS